MDDESGTARSPMPVYLYDWFLNKYVLVVVMRAARLGVGWGGVGWVTSSVCGVGPRACQ